MLVAVMAEGTYQFGETQRHTVLVVDDEPLILFALRDYLGNCGLDVTCASKADEAEVLLRQNRYAVVISDLRLSSHNSAEGLHLLPLAHQQSPMTRTILMTASATPDVVQQASLLGVDVLLNKPAPLRDFADIIFALIQDQFHQHALAIK